MADDLFDLWEAGPVKEIEAPPPIFTVSQITRQIRCLLEKEIDEVWLKGEISNLRAPGSGHLYFTLKDEEALISAVMFRQDAMRLRVPLRDGQAVQLHGRITVYEARGQYQIQVDDVRADGLGALQERFEALKRQLLAEGLFAAERKRSLPVFPEKIGLITAVQGAAIQDFCRILGRRAPGILVQVIGVRVQGAEAAGEVVAAIHEFNRRGEVEVIIVARGGGSLEDLWVFNEEAVARALSASEIPVVSAIGHETDFTMADFVADLRAPTPSAAAELISRDWAEWREELVQLALRLRRATRHGWQFHQARFGRLRESYVFREPVRLVRQGQQTLDEVALHLQRALRTAAHVHRHCWEKQLLGWQQVDPRRKITQNREHLIQWGARLRALSPELTLARGFALVTDEHGRCVRQAEAVREGATLNVRLAQGQLRVQVFSKMTVD